MRKDGSRFWASVVITALRDSEGALIGFAKITRDLTERKQVERRLAESEEQLRLLVQGNHGLRDLDARRYRRRDELEQRRRSDHGLRRGGDARQALFPFLSRPRTSTAPSRGSSCARRTTKAVLQTKSWRVRKDGTQFWASTVISALYDAERKHRGYVHVLQDLTQRRNAESLAETSRRMHEFIAMLAHELRNPLAPIRNAVELMRKRGMGDRTLEAMRDTVDRQVATLSRIIDDLLDVNRISRGQFAVVKEDIDLRDVIRRALETSRPVIDSQAHRLAVTMPERSIPIHGDAVRLAQALANLLNNAARYTSPGGLITIVVEPRVDEVTVRVVDTGRGIAPADSERIFDLFTQVSPADSGLGGLGVGLALVRRVVELHGGTVRVKSSGLGHGSEFAITLPSAVHRPDALQAGRTTNEERCGCAAPISRARRRRQSRCRRSAANASAGARPRVLCRVRRQVGARGRPPAQASPRSARHRNAGHERLRRRGPAARRLRQGRRRAGRGDGMGSGIGQAARARSWLQLSLHEARQRGGLEGFLGSRRRDSTAPPLSAGAFRRRHTDPRPRSGGFRKKLHLFDVRPAGRVTRSSTQPTRGARSRPRYRRLRRRSERHCYVRAGRSAVRLRADVDVAADVSADERRAGYQRAHRPYDGPRHCSESEAALSRPVGARNRLPRDHGERHQPRRGSRRHGGSDVASRSDSAEVGGDCILCRGVCRRADRLQLRALRRAC